MSDELDHATAPGITPDEACVLGHPEPTERYIGLACRRHYHWLDRTLTQIEELFTLRGDVLIPGPSGDTRSGTRVGSPAPGRVDVMALTDPRGVREWIGDDDAIPDVPGALDTWVRIIEEEKRDAQMRPERIPVIGPRCPLRADPTLTLRYVQRMTCAHESCRAALPLDPPTLAEYVRFLRRWRHWIAAQPWLDDYASDLAALHRHVARGVGDTMWPRPIGKCPNCGTPMYPTIGVDEAHCYRCKASWRGVHLQRLRLIHEQEGKRGASTDRPVPASPAS